MGISIDAIIRSKKDNYFLQSGLGMFIMANSSSPKLSAHFQTGNMFINKNIFWINEFNIMYGEFQGAGIKLKRMGKVFRCEKSSWR